VSPIDTCLHREHQPRRAPSAPHEVDLQHIPTSGHFAEYTHPNRAAAEAFAVDKLISLGEGPLKPAKRSSWPATPHLRRSHLPTYA
jgi:hypothetical protein